MAKNSRFVSGSGYVRKQLTVTASLASGAIDLISQMLVWAVTAADSSNLATVEIIGCHRIVELTVVGANAGGNSAVAIGDALYKDGADINKDVTNGVFLGYALGTVSSGGTGTIQVALVGGR
jgi:hypothetical protein